MRSASKLAVLGLVALVSLPAVQASAAEKQPILEFVEAFASDNMDGAHVPGMVFVQVDGNGIVAAEGFGLADLATGRAMTVDTPLRVGSVSKPVTAALALELAAAGRLDLDLPVDRYLDFDLGDGRGPASTTRQLLQHRGGYPAAPTATGRLPGGRPPASTSPSSVDRSSSLSGDSPSVCTEHCGRSSG